MKKTIWLNGIWGALIVAMILVWFVPVPFKPSILLLCGISASILARFV